MKIQKFKPLSEVALSYFLFAMILAFSLYEGTYFYSFPTLEFLEFIFATLCLASTSGFLLLRNHRAIKLLGLIFFFITLGFYLFYSGHHILYGTPPTSNVYVALFETNSSETWEFLEAYVTPMVLFKLFIPVILGFFIYIFLRFAHPVFYKKYALITMLLAIATPISFENLKYKSPYRFVNQFLIYQKERASFRQTFSKEPPAELKITESAERPMNVVMVIGESLARKRMSLYGYQRETNPRLKQLQNELLIYRNIISPHSHTVPSLEKALTFLNHDNVGTLTKNANIIQLARLGGYETFWLSNQPPLGKDETPLNIMANNAHETFWISDSPSFRYNNNIDGNLLPVLNRLLERKGKKFFVLHLMGNHTSYKHRYSHEFNVFTKPMKHSLKLSKDQWDDYNEYDNSVYYNDYVISELIQKLKSVPNTTMVYFSDHGEEVFDNRYVKGHSEALSSNIMFEVPMMVYSNDAIIKSKLNQTFKSRENALWSIEDMIHSLHDLMGFKTTFYEGKRSLFAPEFEVLPRYTAGVLYEPSTELANCPANHLFTPSDKIWVHRVNSKERLEILYDDFAGFEVDVMWEPLKKYFDVRHPPVESIGLSFETYLSVDKAKKYFWLDLKNLTPEFAPDILAELIRLEQKFGIKKRVIVESDNAEALKSIGVAGFATSFYLPKKKNQSPNTYAREVGPRIQPYHAAISQAGSMLEVLDAKFAACDKLVWFTKDNSESREKIEEIQGRDDIKVILVYKKSKGRR